MFEGVVALIAFLFFPLFFPKLQVLFFAPYLVLTLYKRSWLFALWASLICGVLLDLFSTQTPFGLTPLVYVLTLLILRTQKHNFFEDKLATLALMTSLFSLISTALSALFFLLFAQHALFSLRWVATDLFEMALVDAAYAFVCFTLPHRLMRKAFQKRRHPLN